MFQKIIFFQNKFLELGANLAGHERGIVEEEDPGDMSTSSVSTVNSNKMKSTKPRGNKYFAEQISVLRAENSKLSQDLIESQKNLQTTLKTLIDEQNTSCDILKNFSKQLSNVTSFYERSVSQGYFSDISDPPIIKITGDQSPSPQSPSPQSVSEVDGVRVSSENVTRKHSIKGTKQLDSYRSGTGSGGTRKINFACNEKSFNENLVHIDARLNEWLIKYCIDDISRSIIHGEEFTYEDFVYEMTQAEMHRIGLK